MKSEIILLRVLEQVQHVHTIGGIDHFMYTDHQVEQMKQDATVYLKKINQQLVTEGFTVKTMINIGDIAKEIINTTNKENVSIVAMSSHGKSSAIQWVLGSISNKILQAGNKPLLLVRPSDKS
jgi:nucleotide-binding universal stress UspA family protein